MTHATDTSADRCLRLLLFSCAVSIGIAAMPPRAVGQDLSGTITYTGSREVVSDSEPIMIFLFAFDPNTDTIDRIYVPTNGGAFVMHAPAAGNYYLFYSVDVHDYRDGSASVGAPFQVYNHRFTFSYPEPFPADPILVPQAGASLTFDDTAIISGIAGTVTHDNISPVSHGTKIQVEAFSNPDFTGVPDRSYTRGRRRMVAMSLSSWMPGDRTICAPSWTRTTTTNSTQASCSGHAVIRLSLARTRPTSA